MRAPLDTVDAVDELPDRNSQPLFDERDRFCGYLVIIEGRAPFVTTTNCTPSSPVHASGRQNKAHATRLRAVDRLLATLVEEAAA